jgi:hypothetical protein
VRNYVSALIIITISTVIIVITNALRVKNSNDSDRRDIIVVDSKLQRLTNSDIDSNDEMNGDNGDKNYLVV